jgi:Ca2+-binding EF-hand superfamily protein
VNLSLAIPVTLAVALSALGASAQGSGARPEAPPQQPGSTDQRATIVSESRYDRARSWALFAACDADADDRLSLFEVRRSFVDLGGADNLDAFRRLDTDASGFVEWPEFDRRFRLSIEQAGSFRVRPSRAVSAPRDPAAPASDADPVLFLIISIDTDGDDRLDLTEFTELLRLANVDPALSQGFAALDTDRSGELDRSELGPALQVLPGIWQLMPGESNSQTNLPIEFRPVDRNLDGVIDAKELEASLRRTDPTLVRWAARILRDADRSGNGSLGATEIRAASP